MLLDRYINQLQIYTNENIEIKTQRLTANSIGLKPVSFKSLIEIVEPTKNKVTNNNRLEIITIVLVIVIGRM